MTTDLSRFSDVEEEELRDPEGRRVDPCDPVEVREKMLDKTLADTFPASDPPSSDPAPAEDPYLEVSACSASAVDSHRRTERMRNASSIQQHSRKEKP
jgi:hypothetical protein